MPTICAAPTHLYVYAGSAVCRCRWASGAGGACKLLENNILFVPPDVHARVPVAEDVQYLKPTATDHAASSLISNIDGGVWYSRRHYALRSAGQRDSCRDSDRQNYRQC